MGHYTLCITCIFAGAYLAAQSPMSPKDGIALYAETRHASYFGIPTSHERQEQLEAFEKAYPQIYAELNRLTNNAQIPGKRFIPTVWLPRYLDRVAQTFSGWFGWHNAVLDALRPSYDTQQTNYHETNVRAYLDAVIQYLYNRYNIADYNVRDILISLLTQLQLDRVYAIPLQDNVFAQLLASITQEDMPYIRQQLQPLEQKLYQQKIELLRALLQHFDHINLALQAVAEDVVQRETAQAQS